MGKYFEKRKRAVGEIAVVGVQKRAKTATSSASYSPGAKIPMSKNVRHISSNSRPDAVDNEEDCAFSSSSLRQETTSSLDCSVIIVEEKGVCEVRSDYSPVSCCSSNDGASCSDEMFENCCIEITDELEVENATASRNSLCPTDERRESNKKHIVEEEEADNLATPSMFPDAKSTVQIKMPSDAEIEDFFITAEKDIQNRFIAKYNFDVVNDVPLKEGRYEWVPVVKPSE